MELYPILECRNKLNDGLWYVISPTSSVQVGRVYPVYSTSFILSYPIPYPNKSYDAPKSPVNALFRSQIGGGVGSKLSARDSDVYVTCGAQPDQSFGTVYHLSLGELVHLTLFRPSCRGFIKNICSDLSSLEIVYFCYINPPLQIRFGCVV